MYIVETTGQFEKDYKRCKKRGCKLELLHKLFKELAETGTTPTATRPHKLKGNYNGLWECHIESDWLLVWSIDIKAKVISLARTGTHSDLF
jgi:mRNA interferase YafQ